MDKSLLGSVTWDLMLIVIVVGCSKLICRQINKGQRKERKWPR